MLFDLHLAFLWVFRADEQKKIRLWIEKLGITSVNVMGHEMLTPKLSKKRE